MLGVENLKVLDGLAEVRDVGCSPLSAQLLLIFVTYRRTLFDERVLPHNLFVHLLLDSFLPLDKSLKLLVVSANRSFKSC